MFNGQCGSCSFTLSLDIPDVLRINNDRNLLYSIIENKPELLINSLKTISKDFHCPRCLGKTGLKLHLK